MSRILLVGAYERDNFGDLLFLLVTQRYLRGAHVVAAAPFAADMTPLLDRHVPAYPDLLAGERFDTIWSVGGQIGSIDVSRAYRMSAPPEELRRFLRSPRRQRQATLARLDLGAAPYIPDAPADLRVVNSAGLSGIRAVPSPRREALVELLRAQDAIGVRDRASSDYLAELGIGHNLAPDAVHALGVVHPGARDRDSDIAVVQISAAILADLGREQVAARLAHSRALRGLRLRFLLAGAAPGHDSALAYEALGRRIRDRHPGADVGVYSERDPCAIVEQIRRARVVVSTSLHVRIVAATYGVPRVSLARPKTTRYARTWDAAMPYGVTLDGLDRAVTIAVRRGEFAGPRTDLARLAHGRLEHLAGLALGVPARLAA